MILTNIQRFSTGKKTLPPKRPRISYLENQLLCSWVCQQLPHPLAFPTFTPFSPSSTHYIIYIENINNIGRLHLGQV
jgi:hypothetical protein